MEKTLNKFLNSNYCNYPNLYKDLFIQSSLNWDDFIKDPNYYIDTKDMRRLKGFYDANVAEFVKKHLRQLLNFTKLFEYTTKDVGYLRCIILNYD